MPTPGSVIASYGVHPAAGPFLLVLNLGDWVVWAGLSSSFYWKYTVFADAFEPGPSG